MSSHDLDISRSDRERVFQLWDELAAIPSAEIDRAWRHLATTIAGWIQSDMVYWVATVRLLSDEQAANDPLFGWRVRVVEFLDPPSSAAKLAAHMEVNDRLDEPGMTTIAAVRDSGVFRVRRLHHDFIDLDKFRQTDYYRKNFVELGIRDELFVACPISPETEVYYVFNRREIDGLFNAPDAEIAGYALRGLSWFHRQMVYSHGLLVARDPLTPMQREVLQLLLSDKSEKAIAAELGQSYNTTHSHVKEIFRKYNVKSRAGLMAVWLG